MNIKGRKTAINFFDLSGDDDYKEIRDPFFKEAQGIVMVFDLENKESFTNLVRWEKLMRDSGVDTKKSVVFVVGNKCDSKQKECDFTDITNFCKKRGYEYFAASASTGENVNELFEKMFTKCVEKILEDYQKLL